MDEGRSHGCWVTVPSYLRPVLSELSSVQPASFHRQSRCRQEWLHRDWGVLLLDVIMNIAVVIYSRHLSRWRVDYFVCEGNVSPINMQDSKNTFCLDLDSHTLSWKRAHTHTHSCRKRGCLGAAAWERCRMWFPYVLSVKEKGEYVVKVTRLVTFISEISAWEINTAQLP